MEKSFYNLGARSESLMGGVCIVNAVHQLFLQTELSIDYDL